VDFLPPALGGDASRKLLILRVGRR
jgi:hypothetical protein